MKEIFGNIKNLIISKNFLEAENILNEALSKSPEDKELIKLKAELRLKQGESLWDEGETENALDNFIEALQLDSENKEIILKCGNILIELEQVESAKNLYENYLKKYPEDKDILKALSTLEIPSQKEIKFETPEIKVSAIISTYNSEKFIKGCLEDLINQTLYEKGELEIVIIDSASKQNEKEIIKRFQEKHKNIVYVRTDKRETLYASWNRAIKIAKGRYITNANTDDRHRHDALEIMCKVLDENPEIKLVYGDCYLSFVPNEPFEDNPKNRIYKYPDYFAPSSLIHYQFGPQPMWKKEIHETLGYFDGNFKAAGDLDFNIRFSFKFKALHIPEVLGTYLKHEDALSFRDNSAIKEAYSIFKKYRTIQNIFSLYMAEGFQCDSPEEKSRILVDIGIRAMEFYTPWGEGRPSSDFAFAIECFKTAHDIYPDWSVPINNLAISLFLSRHRIDALKIIRDIPQNLLNNVINENKKIISGRVTHSYSKPKIISSGLNLPSQKELSHATIESFLETVDESQIPSLTLKPEKTHKGKDTFSIMFVVHNFYTHLLAGTELYTYNLAKKFIQKGHTVTIVYPFFDNTSQYINIHEENFEDISLVKILLRPPRNMIEGLKNEYVANAFNSYLSENPTDIVHFHHFYRISFSPLNVCFEHGIPIIASLHDELILCERIHYLQPDGKFCSGPETVDKCVKCFIAWHPYIVQNKQLIEFLTRAFSFRRQYLQNALNWIDTLTVPSLFLKNELIKHGFTHPETILLPLGVYPFNVIPHQPSQDLLRFSFIGNIAFTKGLDILIKAFNNIKAKNIALNIYGKVLDENYFEQVKAVNLKSEKVKYHGAYTPQELPEILSKTDIAIVPSRSESYSLVVRECLYCGVPVIASNVGGIPEIIKDGENGLLFESGNYKELSKKIQFVIDNPEIIKTLKSNIKPVQTINEDAERLEEIYKQTISRKTHIML